MPDLLVRDIDPELYERMKKIRRGATQVAGANCP